MSATLTVREGPSVRSQKAFRSIMQAMAQPGLIVTLDGFGEAPGPLMPAATATLVTLCDFETSLWVSPRFLEAAAWLRFQTDARVAAEAADAAFGLVEAAELDIAAFDAGSPAYPDRGATVVVQCPSLTDGPALSLAGPGIAATERFAVAGLPAGFAAQARASRQRFPLGIDLLFACGADILALPRSTRILEGR